MYLEHALSDIRNREKQPASNLCDFWHDKFHPGVLIDAVDYVCLESVKCDESIYQTLGDELTLTETWNQD